MYLRFIKGRQPISGENIMKQIRVLNGVFTQKFIDAHKGQKIAFVMEDFTAETEILKSGFAADEIIVAPYSWRSTDAGEAVLSETETFHIGRDCDYLLLESEDYTIYFGRGFGGWLEYSFS